MKIRCLINSYDTSTLNSFIHQGNTLKLGFTEKEFINYRSEVMCWLSTNAKKDGTINLSDTYYIKSIDIINLDGNFAYVEEEMNKKGLHAYRQAQLSSILLILNEYKSQNTIWWANVRSWISIFIAIGSIIVNMILP